MGEIDTKSIKSVQAALSLFENSGNKKKRSSSDEEMEKERDLEGLLQDLANYKVQLEAKESAYKQSLVKLDHYEETVDGLSTLLKNTELEREICISECKEAEIRINELESKMELTINQLSEAEKIKEQLSLVISELKYTKTELFSAETELVAIREAKVEAMTQAEMAETALNMEKVNNEELLRHLSELNETILHLKLASIEAHNEKCVLLAEKEDELQLANEAFEEAQEEMQYMREELELMKGLEGQLLAKNIFIESLQLELHKGSELLSLAEKSASDAINDTNRLRVNLEIQEKENLDQAGNIESMKMELNQLRLEIKNAKCEVETMTGELEKTKSEINDIGQRENEAQVEIALLKAELHKERSKAAAAEASEHRAKSEKSSVYTALQQLALELDEAKKETRRLKSENLATAKEAEEIEYVTNTSSHNNGTEYDILKKELESATVRIGEFRTRAEQAVSRAEAAELGKAALEAQIQRWRDHKERRKAALVALQEESVSRKNFSFKYEDDTSKTYLPLKREQEKAASERLQSETMAERKPNNVMSVELAIKRELEYRKRVATLLELYDGSMDGHKPLEVPSLNPKPCPSENTSEPNSRPIQTPNLNPFHPLHFPTTNLSPPQKSSLHHSSSLLGSKRKEPSNGKEHKDGIFNGNDTSQKETEQRLFCKICQVHCSSDFNMKQHLRGQKHKSKLLLAKQGVEMEKKRWECQVCEISCSSEDLLKMHLQGKKHLFSLRCIEVNKRAKNADATPGNSDRKEIELEGNG